ncbi:ferritin-like domain-containing protein [Hymenobacter negativus]|uniref:Ferritin-like domain-containing protein n=1 Tax=Hymenobacter negativus TaxID=2795026 RepID=A0ABS3QCM9_9BACT|nr:ferritin-like domain-containing protein [Hymenobacter negativus]MBO2008574.1 ferritin-like domain-containing protein [Hymenobacter negativus]
MDFFQIISDIAKVDPEVYDRLDPRRQVFRNFMSYGKKVTATALPLALGSIFNKAYGQSAGSLPDPVKAVLRLALQLEYLEFFFYDTALNSGNLLAGEPRAAIQIILNDEKLHIKSLRGLLGETDAGPALTRNDFDYTGAQSGSPTPRPALFPALGATFTDLGQFYTASQGFVDTGVRAYKGGAPILMTASNKDVLEAGLNIHSVEARHSSRIRSLRRGGIQSTTAPKSWITPDEVGTPVPLPNNGVPNSPSVVGPYNAGNPPAITTPAASYPAEDNVIQGAAPGVNVQTVAPGVSATAGAEAFDEPLDAQTVKAIAKNFARVPSALFN